MGTFIIYMISAMLLLFAAWHIFRSFVRRDYQRIGHLTWRTAGLQALLFFVYGGFPSIYAPRDWPALHCGGIQKWAGLLSLGVGLTILSLGVVRLGFSRSMGRGDAGLHRSGPYRVTRNPQALGCGLYVIGFAVLWPSWYAAGWALMYPVLIHTMVLTEEEHLLATFGEEYARYCRKVPRYLGRIHHPPSRK